MQQLHKVRVSVKAIRCLEWWESSCWSAAARKSATVQATAAVLLFAPTLALAGLLRLTLRTVPFFASVSLAVQAVQEVFQIGLTEIQKFVSIAYSIYKNLKYLR